MKRLFPIFLLLLLVSCARETDAPAHNTRWTEYKVAIVAPLSESAEYKERIERITDWFVKEFQEGQKNLDQGVTLNFEWFDETSMSTQELEQLGKDFAEREDLAAVVGPFYSTSVDAMASKMYCADIPLIVPVTTSEEVQRRYSVTPTGKVRSPFMWAMTETDVAQIDMLLSVIADIGYDMDSDERPAVGLVASDDYYGKTFTEWVPYRVSGLKMDLTANVQYDEGDLGAIVQSMAQLVSGGAEYAICAAATAADALEFVKTARTYGKNAPQLFFTDAAFNAQFLSQPELVESMQGTAMYASPMSGFRAAYEVRYRELPTPDECKLYDALLLAGLACQYSLSAGEQSMNAAIDALTAGVEGEPVTVWSGIGLEQFLHSLQSGQAIPPLRGVSGQFSFDSDARTTPTQSVYARWRVYDGKFVILYYLSRSGQEGTSEALSTWDVKFEIGAPIPDSNDTVSIKYDYLANQYALLVCGSDNWFNYRHAADVLGMYRLLKQYEYDDDHIILVFNDFASKDRRNIFPGEIRSTSFGPNLLDSVQIDYDAADLNVNDICNILLGKSSDRLPTVLKTDAHSNVLIYWSGHGYDGGFIYPGGDLTTRLLEQTLTQMSKEKRFRKLLFLAEPCHSSSVLNALQGIPGALGIASALATESSFADVYDADLGVWMSDRFTNNLIRQFSMNRSVNYNDLYVYLSEHTLGSHVNIINADNYGNLNKENLYDFLYFTNND